MIETECPLSEQGKENAVPIEPAPKINIFDIIYSLKKNLFIKYITAMISILANIIKIIKDIFVKSFKSIRFKFSIPYSEELTVLVRVNMDNLKESSKVK